MGLGVVQKYILGPHDILEGVEEARMQEAPGVGLGQFQFPGIKNI